MVEQYIFESFLGPRWRSHQGHLKVKVIASSRSFQDQGHSRSRSFQGQGHMKVKGHSYLKLALLVDMTRQIPLSVLSSSLQEYSEYKSALFFIYTAAIWLNITYLSHSWGQGQGHIKVIWRSRSFQGQGHFKVKVIWRSKVIRTWSLHYWSIWQSRDHCQCSLLHYKYIVSTRVLSSSFILCYMIEH